MSDSKFTRKELYDLVWSEPLTTIAKKYQTSDHILRSTCKKYNIPLPKSGHWMKIQFGKSTVKETLDEDYDGSNEISFGQKEGKEIGVSNSSSEFSLIKTKIENDQNVSLVVPERLTRPDKLIVDLKESLDEKESYGGNGNRIRAWDQLKVLVTKENVGRALRIMDTLIKAIKARGHDIIIKNQDTCVVIQNEEIKVSLREKTKRIIVPGKYYNNSQLEPTGILTFNIEGFRPKEWKDGKLILEDQLSIILAKLELEGKRLQIETVEREKYWAEQAKERQILEEKQKVKEIEHEIFLSLKKAAATYREVMIIREYVAAVEESAKARGEINKEVRDWIIWARNKTDWYDPLVNLLEADRRER